MRLQLGERTRRLRMYVRALDVVREQLAGDVSALLRALDRPERVRAWRVSASDCLEPGRKP